MNATHMSLPQQCPCGSGENFLDCCDAIHQGRKVAHTAEQLMRSRYSAFVVGNCDYLLQSWHPSTRPRQLDLGDAVTYQRLAIVDTVAGSPVDEHGIVEFIAYYLDAGQSGLQQQRERSSFLKTDGRWFYVSAL